MSIRNGQMFSSTNNDFDRLYVDMLPTEIWRKAAELNKGNPDIEKERPHREFEETLNRWDQKLFGDMRQDATNKTRQICAILKNSLNGSGREQINELEAGINDLRAKVQTLRRKLEREARSR